MKTIEFEIKETKLVTENGVTGYKTFTKKENLTFAQLLSSYFPNATNGWLSDDYHHCSTKMSLQELQNKLENRNISYEINKDHFKLTVFPNVKTGTEMLYFQQEVNKYSLDSQIN